MSRFLVELCNPLINNKGGGVCYERGSIKLNCGIGEALAKPRQEKYRQVIS